MSLGSALEVAFIELELHTTLMQAMLTAAMHFRACEREHTPKRVALQQPSLLIGSRDRQLLHVRCHSSRRSR